MHVKQANRGRGYDSEQINSTAGWASSKIRLSGGLLTSFLIED